jgi:hypothetical protein
MWRKRRQLASITPGWAAETGKGRLEGPVGRIFGAVSEISICRAAEIISDLALSWHRAGEGNPRVLDLKEAVLLEGRMPNIW